MKIYILSDNTMTLQKFLFPDRPNLLKDEASMYPISDCSVSAFVRFYVETIERKTIYFVKDILLGVKKTNKTKQLEPQQNKIFEITRKQNRLKKR